MDVKTNLIYGGYARKSSEDNKERQAASLPDQLYILEGIKTREKLNVPIVLQESKSAHTPRTRKQFAKLLELIEQGEVNAILTWHANRLARNMSDGADLINLMDIGKLLEIKTPNRIYHTTPEDKWMLSVEFANSKKDSDDKSIVVTRGLEKKCRDGFRPGWAPFGYLNDKFTESGLRKIYEDTERLPFVTKIFELFLSGTAATEIRRICDEEWHLTTLRRKKIGGKPLSLSLIYVILNSPFYCGKFEYPQGSDIWWKNDPSIKRAITEEKFNQVQIKLGNVSKYETKHNYTFAHLMKCGRCGSGIVVDGKYQVICTKCKTKFQITRNNSDTCTGCGTLISEMNNPKIIHYIYGRCGRKKDTNCRELSISEKEMERQIDKRLSEIELNPYFLNWAVEQLRKMHESDVSFRETTVDTTKKAFDDCRRRIDNLVSLKISPQNSDGGLMGDDEFKDRKLALERELKVIEKQLTGMDEAMLKANDETVRAVTFVTRAREKFASGDAKTKRDIFIGLGLHLTLKDKIVHFDAPLYFETIEKMKNDAPIIAKRVAPEESGLDITKTAAFEAAIPTLLRGRESRPVWKIMSLPCYSTLPRMSFF